MPIRNFKRFKSFGKKKDDTSFKTAPPAVSATTGYGVKIRVPSKLRGRRGSRGKFIKKIY